jgi:hypothetical protein
MHRKTLKLMSRSAALLLGTACAAGPAAFAAESPLAAGQKGTLRVEFDQSGNNNGKPIHRTMTMVLRMQALPGTGYDPFAKDDPNAVAKDERTAATLGKRAAAVAVKKKQLDMDAIARACAADPQGAACQAGQKAFAESVGAMDQALNEAASAYSRPPPADPNRFQPWRALLGKEGEGCGTIEARVLDPGKTEPVARLPSSPATAELETCFSMMTIDRTKHEASLHLKPIQIRRPNATESRQFVIDGTAVNIDGVGDFDWSLDMLHIRDSRFQGSGGQISGSATYRSPRAVTVVRWTFSRN